MHAHTLPQTRPAFFTSALTYAGSMWLGSSIGISTVSNPHFLNWGKSFVESLVNGDVKRKVLIPSLMGSELSAARGKYQILQAGEAGAVPATAPRASLRPRLLGETRDGRDQRIGLDGLGHVQL